MVGVGVIGYGYWGPNLVRNFSETADARVIAVSDLRSERLEAVKTRYPSIQVTRDHRELLSNSNIDAITIATPVGTHFDLAMEALHAGKHVFIEKPIADSIDKAEKLIEEAEKRQRVLMVDHTFVYTGAVQKIKEIIDTGRLGNLYYYDSVRVNLGLFQHDVNVLWDLAVHDLSIMDFVLGRSPLAVSVTGSAHVAGQPEDMAYLTCFFDDSFLAHVHVNWLAPVKIRRTLIGGNREMIVYDDLEPSEKIKVYDSGITLSEVPEGLYKTVKGYRTGDMWSPQLDTTEAIREEVDHFIECIRTGRRPITDGAVGLRVVRILAAASQSLAQNGVPVEL